MRRKMRTKMNFVTKPSLANNLETGHSKIELQQLAVSSKVKIIEGLSVFQTEQFPIGK